MRGAIVSTAAPRFIHPENACSAVQLFPLLGDLASCHWLRGVYLSMHMHEGSLGDSDVSTALVKQQKTDSPALVSRLRTWYEVGTLTVTLT